MTFFSPDLSSPTDILDLLIGPLLFTFFGVMMYIGSVRHQDTFGKEAKWWKWCFLLIAIGVLFGLQRFIFLQDFVYKQTVQTRKQWYGHYLGLIIPVSSIVGIFLHRFLRAKKESRRVY